MKHLYFVRHGLSVMNKLGIFSGRVNTPLAEEGVAQATAAGLALQDKQVDLIIASPMERTRETARIIADQIGYPRDNIVISDLFIERDFGSLEGAPYDPNLDMEGIEDVEPTEDILARAQLGLAYLQDQPYDTIVVVSHGAIGRALRHAIDPRVPFHGSTRFENAQVVKLL